MKNPYYSPEAFGLDLLSFDQPDLSYEYNTLCFWSIDGRVYEASDSGCSCPTPFEDYEGKTVEEVCQKLNRVGSIEQGLSSFDSWNHNYVDSDSRRNLEQWLRNRLQ